MTSKNTPDKMYYKITIRMAMEDFEMLIDTKIRL